MDGNGVRFGSREGLGGSEVSQYFELYLMVGIWVVGAQQVGWVPCVTETSVFTK